MENEYKSHIELSTRMDNEYIAHIELSTRYDGVLVHTEQKDIPVVAYKHNQYFDLVSFRIYINGNYSNIDSLIITCKCDICDSNNQFIMNATMNQKPKNRGHRFVRELGEVYPDTYLAYFEFLVPRQVKENKDED